ncbi:MAG: choice-of-anchor D domain-containing protein [Bdellovibrionales bacterium]|nr:choice-of-anchor D domain-containing protein [Bdellovibrionales bacterium]
MENKFEKQIFCSLNRNSARPNFTICLLLLLVYILPACSRRPKYGFLSGLGTPSSTDGGAVDLSGLDDVFGDFSDSSETATQDTDETQSTDVVSPLTATPAILDFGPIGTEQSSRVKTLTLKNPNSNSISIVRLGLSGPFGGESLTCRSVLAAGQSCEVRVRFHNLVPAGNKEGTFTAVYNDGERLEIALRGETVVRPTILAQSSSLSFGPVQVSAAVASLPLTVINNGSVAANYSLSVSNAAYEISGNCTDIAPGQSCTYSVAFKPLWGIRYDDRIAIALSDPYGSRPGAQLSVSGRGVLTMIANGTLRGSAQVQVRNGLNLQMIREFLPFGGFTGGVNVATCDFNGDGQADLVTGTGPGAGRVIVWDLLTMVPIADFHPYSQQFDGGVFVACGDLNADGTSDLVTGAGPGGGPHVKSYITTINSDRSIRLTERLSFYAYDPGFRGGVRVAVGNTVGDARAEIATAAGVGGGPHIEVFSSNGTLLSSFFANDPNSHAADGASIAIGDVYADSHADLLVRAYRNDPQYRIHNTEGTLMAYGGTPLPRYIYGLELAVADLDCQGGNEVVTTFELGSPIVLVVRNDFTSQVTSYWAYHSSSGYEGGLSVSAAGCR